jgi:hypothetical protein
MHVLSTDAAIVGGSCAGASIIAQAWLAHT